MCHRLVRYPLGYLITERWLTSAPTLHNIIPAERGDFAFVWLYAMMTEETSQCNLNALTLGLWGRYRDDTEFIGVEAVDGQEFLALVSLIARFLKEDHEDTKNQDDTMVGILWETDHSDVYTWWRNFHHRCAEIGFPCYDPLRSWARFVRLWDQAALEESTVVQEIPNQPRRYYLGWMIGSGLVASLAFTAMAWLRQDR